MLALTGTRMNSKSRGFVDDEQSVIFEKDVEWNRLWARFDFLRRRFDEIDRVTTSDDLPRPRRRAVELNEPAANQLLKPRARVFWKALG